MLYYSLWIRKARDMKNKKVNDMLNSIKNGLNNGKKNILYVLHSDFRKDSSDNAGGTQYHVRDLVNGLRNRYNFFVAARDLQYLKLTIYLQEKMYTFKFFIDDYQNEYYNSRIKNILFAIINEFKIECIHVHHVYHLSLDIYNIASELNIPIITTLHDYYYICPSIKLLNEQSEFCANQNENIKCKECEVNGRCDIEKWRKINLKILSLSEKLIVPSNAAKKVYIKYFPELEEKMTVLPHGSDCVSHVKDVNTIVSNLVQSDNVIENIEKIFEDRNKIEGWVYLENVSSMDIEIYLEIFDGKNARKLLKANNKEREDLAAVKNELYRFSGFEFYINKEELTAEKYTLRLIVGCYNKFFISGKEYRYTPDKKNLMQNNNAINIAFVGGMVEAKGSKIAYEMIRKCSDKEIINWYIFGAISPEDKELIMCKQENLYKIGQYEKDDIYNILQAFSIDVICILPIWAETFCYTLSEAWLSKIPTIVTDIGAVAERTKAYGCGWIIPLDMCAGEMIDFILKVTRNSNEYESKRNNLEKQCVISIAEMCEQYRILYNGFVKCEIQYSSLYDSDTIKNGLVISKLKLKQSILMKLKWKLKRNP